MDQTFGQAGVVFLAPPASGPALIQQPDAKLVVAGGGILMARYLPDGTADTTFGSGGMAATSIGVAGRVVALLQQTDGKLVVGGSVSTPGRTAILLARYEALGCSVVNPEPCLGSLATFVTEVYAAALARRPTASEEATWVEALASAPNLDTARDLLHAVFDGPEFLQRPVNPWQYVDALYLAMLGREPAPAELDWWVQQVLDRFNTLPPGFVDSQEFQRLVPGCRDVGAVSLLVGRLYLYALGRGGSPAELTWWTQAIVGRCAVEEGVEDFFNSLEYLTVPRTRADHVTRLYRALLAREPDAGERAWWVADLSGQLAELEDDIMASMEFAAQVFQLYP
jgi:hypothetical protein